MSQQQQRQLLRKISARTVFGSKADIQSLVLADRSKAHPLFTVFGICNGTRQGQSKDIAEEISGPNNTTIMPPRAKAQDGDGKSKDWTALLGQFRAENLQTRKVYTSGVCFLPNYVTDTVAGQLGGDVETVKFGFTIMAKFDEDSATSYIFEAENLMPPQAEDALESMAKAISAPVATPPATPPADAPKAPETATGSAPADKVAEPKAKR